jgi:acyl-CoA oxidase
VDVTKTVAAASGGQMAFEGAAWNSNTVDLIRLARAHCLLVLHSTFADSVHRLEAEVATYLAAANIILSFAKSVCSAVFPTLMARAGMSFCC